MTDIAIRTQGGGPPLLLLHAFPLHAGMWEPQSVLAAQMTLLTLDLPGFGESAGAAPLDDLDELAAMIAARVRALGFAQCAIAGCSMGGYLAFALLRVAPELIRGLAFIDTKAAADSAQVRERRYASIARVEREGAGFLRDEWPPSALSPKTLREQPHVVDATRALVARATAAGVVAALRAMARRPDATPQLAAIRVPALVIHGEDDPLIPLAEAQQMARSIGAASFVRVDGAGHLPNMEHPEAVNSALAALLRRCAG